MWGFVPLPAAVAAELAHLEAGLGQVADEGARAALAGLSEAAAARVLGTVADTGDRVRSLSAFIRWLARREAMEMQHNAGAGIPAAAAESESFSSDDDLGADDSLHGPLYNDNVQMEVQSPDGGIAFGVVPNQARIEPWSPAQKMPSRLQNGQRSRASTVADPAAQVSGYKGDACHPIYKSCETLAAINGRLESHMRRERRRFVATLVLIAAILYSIVILWLSKEKHLKLKPSMIILGGSIVILFCNLM